MSYITFLAATHLPCTISSYFLNEDLHLSLVTYFLNDPCPNFNEDLNLLSNIHLLLSNPMQFFIHCSKVILVYFLLSFKLALNCHIQFTFYTPIQILCIKIY